MITAGVDIGSRSIEIVLTDGAQVIEALTTNTGSAPTQNAKKAFWAGCRLDSSDVAARVHKKIAEDALNTALVRLGHYRRG